MKAMIFAAGTNSPNKRDAAEFQAEADRFRRCHELMDPVHIFDNTKPVDARRAQTLEFLSEAEPDSLDTVVFFSHGWPDGMQSGFTKTYVPQFAAALKRCCKPVASLVLYCCSTAADGDKSDLNERKPGPGGDGGFADAVRDEAARVGFSLVVYGHSVVGHTTENPYARVFVPVESKGGTWVLGPDSPLWAQWVRALKSTGRDGKFDATRTFRFRYPYMQMAEITAFLKSPQK